MGQNSRDHGGGLDQAMEHFGGMRPDWIDLSTGINPVSYPLPDFPAHNWASLPDNTAQQALLEAARNFWQVPEAAAILAAPGVSALIARLPALLHSNRVAIRKPTYNEHAAAFRANGWQVSRQGIAQVFVHPNNPDGRLFGEKEILETHKNLTIIDESFCDTCPQETRVKLALTPDVVVLKGLGKFWGLAGLRLGFAIALPETIERLSEMLGPWAVSGPALHLGNLALRDQDWAIQTRERLTRDAKRLDRAMQPKTSSRANGTDLFRLYQVDNPSKFQKKLAQSHIWSRIFPYSNHFLRLGLPGTETEWNRLKTVLEDL